MAATIPGDPSRHGSTSKHALATVDFTAVLAAEAAGPFGTGIGAVGTKQPSPQCAQRAHPMRSMRHMNAATDSTTTGSGAGTDSAARACASFTALPAGPSKP